MGYSIQHIRGGDVRIPAENVAKLVADILVRPDEAWWNEPPRSNDLEQLLYNWGILTYAPDDTGDVLVEGIEGGTKAGEDLDYVLDLVARHADPRRVDWIMVGEDGLVWAERFENGEHRTPDVHMVVSEDVLWSGVIGGIPEQGFFSVPGSTEVTMVKGSLGW